MPDPSWTAQYLFNQTPEGNGFTRTLYGTPVVTEVTSGPPADRRLEIQSDNGNAVFLTSDVPSLDSSIGATGEIEVAVSGSGDGGFELTLLDTVIAVNIFQTFVEVYSPNPGGTPTYETYSGQDNSPNTKWRVTIDPLKKARLYRNDLEITPIGGLQAHTAPKPFQRVLFWGEGGGLAVYKGMRYYQGGAVEAG